MIPKERGRYGFTLIELIIVIVIIGILASIASTAMSSNIQKAKRAEAVAALGTIRTAERMYYVEYGCYTGVTNWTSGPLSGYIAASALDGTYYKNGRYVVSLSGTASYNIVCLTRDVSKCGCGASADPEVSMNERGYITT